MRLKYIILLSLASSIACKEEYTAKNTLMNENNTLHYLALGDSYTIGTAIAAKDAFPYQLTDSIEAHSSFTQSEVKLIARNAWRTDDLQRAIKRTDLEEKYDLVSLLIGVNNQYQGLPLSDFKNDFNALLDTCEKYSLSKSRIFVLSIPNYGYTPFGAEKREIITQELAAFNTAIEEICSERDVSLYNVTDISLEAVKRPEFVAKDGLHPSKSQYGAWISSFFESVLMKLED